MRFYLPKYFIVLIINFAFLCHVVAGELPDSAQMEKLVEAVWEEAPTSMDVTFYRETSWKPLGEAAIRAFVENSYSATDHIAANGDQEYRKSDIDKEVALLMKERQSPKLSLQRCRLDGHLMRIDEKKLTFLREDEIGLEYTRTTANVGDSTQGDYTRFELNHVTKMATIFNDKSKFERPPLEDLALFPTPARTAFKIILGAVVRKDDNSFFMPDRKKIAQIQSGQLEGYRMDIEKKVVNGLDMNIISLSLAGKDKPIIKLLCDSNDYSKSYKFEIFDPETGNKKHMREASEFDNDGVPHNVKLVDYLDDGGVKKYESYAIQEISINPIIPKDIFEFKVPSGYALIDRRPEVPFAVMPTEDIASNELQRLDAANKEVPRNGNSLQQKNGTDKTTLDGKDSKKENTDKVVVNGKDNKKENTENGYRIPVQYVYIAISLLVILIILAKLKKRK